MPDHSSTPTTRIKNPEWLNRSVFPFAAHHLEAEPGRVHYVDEGSGPPVLMLHGNPTWSFLYRHLINHLAPDYRCVAPDYLGFGLSDKPTGWSYHPRDHAHIISALIEKLDLRDVTLVVQDWGGPIGLSYAVHHPERVRRLVIMNTWMWPLDDDWMARLFSSVLGSRAARFFIQRLGLFERILLPLALGSTNSTTLRHYQAPLARSAWRTGVAAFPGAMVGATGWLRTLWRRRERLAGKPAYLLWGLRDPICRASMLQRWQRLLPQARTEKLPHVGHFVQEQLGPALGPRVAHFLEAT